MLGNNAISLNNVRHNDENESITRDMAIDGKVIIIRKGKKKQYICLFD